MIRRGDKRGSHVGVVLSFAIFVTFLIFLYTLSQPSFQEQQREKAIMPYLEKKLIENSSSPLTIMTANISTSVAQDCVQLDSFMDTFSLPNNRVVVWDAEQVSTSVAVSGNNLRINRNDANDNFFKIYYSQYFDLVGIGNTWNCGVLSEGAGGYVLGSTKVENYVFEEKLFELMDNYNEFYEDFKSDLGVPLSFEFGFGLIYSNGTTIETSNIDLKKNIYVKEIPIQYVSESGKIEQGFLKLKTW